MDGRLMDESVGQTVQDFTLTDQIWVYQTTYIGRNSVARANRHASKLLVVKRL